MCCSAYGKSVWGRSCAPRGKPAMPGSLFCVRKITIISRLLLIFSGNAGVCMHHLCDEGHKACCLSLVAAVAGRARVSSASQLMVPSPPPPRACHRWGVSPCEGLEERHKTERHFSSRTEGDGGGGRGGGGGGGVCVQNLVAAI